MNTNMNSSEIAGVLYKCWHEYKHRLESDYYDQTRIEFDKNLDIIIDKICDYSAVKNISFSITSDPSLHYTIRFVNGHTLFIETFLDLEDGHDHYIELFDSVKFIYALKVNSLSLQFLDQYNNPL